MLKHYGDNAQAEGTRRVDELAENGDNAGVAIWMRIFGAIREPANTTAPGPVH
jgi:hypothetical protein